MTRFSHVCVARVLGGTLLWTVMFVLPSAQGGQGGEGSCDLNPRTPMGTRPSWGLRLDQA